ncbi:MAG: tRNA glutamyl-Q(34) synthetase GluQRS [Gemmataceae bacterium]|nr:tRNA glutamyl-Q(34) synthetase GluQRS [Gemmata sp.]MDW8196736.1 tRNA glutamyl-Q(34) synthetase GluQRS [Gemmataceae bacterium]
MKSMASPVVGRLAPSPTGAQHVGNARTYLIAWLSARAQGGMVKLRIEDIDSPRVKPGAAAAVLDDLRWLGLDWDGEPVVQTTRWPYYQAALEELKKRDLVYPCTCTRSDIAAAASAPHAGEEIPYPGTCAQRCVADASALHAAGTPWAWRFRVRESPRFTDRFAGPCHIDLKHISGDFVVWKKFAPSGNALPPAVVEQGTPAYQLAVVIDDAAMGVTEVLRGDDLIPSTPRQLLLYRAFGLTPPEFAHIPLVVGPDGRRLAKRHGDTRLAALRAAGVKPERLIGLLAWSCGWLAKPEPISARELLPLFRLASIPPRPFVLTQELLHAIGYPH